jgi:hypothetical protein
MAELFGADLRSLAVFRISLAVLILIDLLNRSADLTAHYTDLGVLPRSVVTSILPNGWRFSIHFLSGSSHGQAILFLLAALFAVALLIGYHTRLATVVSWALLVSLHVRNPLVLQRGDTLLRMLLFWAMFLPLGARFSWDRVRMASAHPFPARVVSIGSVALFAQVAFVYWFTAAHKSGVEWWREGSAVYYALNLDRLVTPVGLFLLHFPSLLSLLTYAVIWFEVLGPLLLFTPVYTGHVRTATVFAFFCLQLGFGLCLALGLFPWISAAAMLPFVPTWAWDKLLGWRPVERVGAALYAKIASNHLAGTDSATSWAFCPLTLRSSRLANILAAFFLLYVFFWNLGTLKDAPYKMPVPFTWLGTLLGIHQKWDMFAPRPPKFSGWYVIPGTLRDGVQVDLFQDGKAVRWEKPALVSATYKNQRWRKYLRNIYKKKNDIHRLYFAQYLCREWSTRHGENKQLAEVEIYFLREETLPQSQVAAPHKVLLWKHSCSQEDFSPQVD